MTLPSFQSQTERRCGGFLVDFAAGAPEVRLLTGDRALGPGVPEAVLRGLAEAPRLVASALRVNAQERPYQRVEVTLHAGGAAQGEAVPSADGVVRLQLGEEAAPDDVAALARHEALHLLLAASMRAGPLWNDPGLAFTEWIVRGLESGLDPAIPRFAAPPEPLPVSRAEVQQKLAAPRKHFSEPLAAALESVDAPQKRLWLAEAALGTHYLEAAARAGAELRAVVLDDWLLGYEQYVRGVGNPPSGAGHFWRVSEPGFARDPLVRLSAAAQALMPGDACWFAGERGEEPVVWKSRGRVRVPIVRPAERARPAPVHVFRSVVRDVPEVAPLVEQAARGAQSFEARALWPRILARVLKPTHEHAPGLVQLVDGPGAEEAFALWQEAAVHGAPRIAEPQHLGTLSGNETLLLVFPQPATPETLLAARKLAARRRVRGAVFRDELCDDDHLPDTEPPLDARYREEVWAPGPSTLASVDEATRDGRLSTPISHLLSMMSFGIDET